MNILTNAQIKRRGIAAVEDALRRGPVHLIKRNRQVGVVVSEADYAAAAARSGAQLGAAPQPDFLDWFMSDQPSGNLDAAGLRRRIAMERDSWNER